ncbi:DUF3939 domain-containing protein [Paenibacillus albiflavus]|uniref:DUF3939 domain-containing protein n=1 Tax=Paenibacillus albiflavus TaxID=2545760 RepID=A0A4R4ECP8_9BACL|nr:DUF3939 domain-containing protein [Paenibacillus albiflavus]TCZ77177.1 DUF3939 domain-containing protein [Paenibacillus albiflavus]
MLRFWRREKKDAPTKPHTKLNLTLREVKEAINKYEETLTELGIKRTVLIEADNQINFELLAMFLGGVPDKKFYMSRETYEIFEEKDKHIPVYLDMVQGAVDDYISEKRKLPIIDNSSDQRVNFDLLIHNHNLKEKPTIPLFISNQSDMVTHDENWRQDS